MVEEGDDNGNEDEVRILIEREESYRSRERTRGPILLGEC